MPDRSSLQHRTVRPGGAASSSSYYASARTGRTVKTAQASTGSYSWGRIAAVALVLVIGAFFMFHGHGSPKTATAPVKKTTPVVKGKTPVPAPAIAATPNACAGNQLPKFISVDISDRHLWACDGTKQLFDSAVITGNEAHAATLTPVGTYKIYSKVKDTVLTGADETGSWRDPVSYWMPWLDNQYGTYGFHDATWRDNSAFGQVDPNSDDASHGCVELPLATAAWIYNWAEVGTTLTVKA